MPYPAEVEDVDIQSKRPQLAIPTVQEFQRSLGEGSLMIIKRRPPLKNSDENIREELIN